MSWWDSSKGFSSLASQALKTAQSKIDKVLDIQDKGGLKLSSNTNSSDISSNQTETSLKSEPGVLEEESWNSWLGSDAVGFGGENWGNSQFLESKKTSSISNKSSNNAPTLDIGKTNDGSTNKTVSKKSSKEEMSETLKSDFNWGNKTVEDRSTSLTAEFQNAILDAGVEIITDKGIITTEKEKPTLSQEECSKLSSAGARQLSGGGTSVKKGAPLKLSIKPKSKDQAEKKDEDRNEKVDEMLKREKEAELQLIEMLGDDKKQLLQKSGSTNVGDGVAKNSENKDEKDIIKPKEIKEQEEPQKTLSSLTSETNTDTIDINIAQSDWGDAGLLTESQINEESNGLMMQSQNSNWGEAKMLTESQIMNISVGENKQNYLPEKSEITNEIKLSNISGTEDPEVGKQLDESALEVEKIQTAQYETEKTATDMKQDANIGQKIKSEILESKFISEVPQDIEKIDKQDSLNQHVITAEKENIVEDKETDDMITETISKYTDTISGTDNLNSEDIAAALSAKLESTELKCDSTQDAGSIISTLDGSSTSETVDELSSSNQTLTADDFQSSVTSNKSSDKEIESETVNQVEKSHADCDNKTDSDHIIEEKLNTVCQDSESNVSEKISSDTYDVAISDDTGDQDLIKTRSSTEDSVQSTESVRSSQSEGNVNQTQNMTESHSSQCSSSSYVKNMLEEAMVESIKDLDSRSDCVSHSSSDMVRIESDQNSGHTSGDDLETAASSITSSDIEIISHISTPTPNGENRGFGGVSLERPFDLSPLRQALNKAVRRNSPPGHKRSDSGSSAYSMHSKNGDDVTSPVDSSGLQRVDRDIKPRDESSSDPYEREKLLKECTTTTQTEQLQPITEGLEHSNTVPSGQCTSVDSHKLLEKLAEKAELLEAREKKLVDLSRQNMDLMESNNILKNQLQQSEEARAMEMTDVNQLTDEFTKRLSDSEKRLNQAVKECDMLKKKKVPTATLR